VAVSLADKLDSLAGFFAFNLKPTGSKDPYALRRAGLGLIEVIIRNGVRVSLGKILAKADEQVLHSQPSISASISGPQLRSSRPGATINTTVEAVLDFLADRLKGQQREAGVRHDLIDAVFALGNEDDLVRLLARVNALQSFIETGEGLNLLAAYKRAANILKKENWTARANNDAGGLNTQGVARTGEEDPLAIVDDPELRVVVEAQMQQKRENALSYSAEPAEKALIGALDQAEPQARAAVAAEDFTAAMQALASLRQPIDAFFDTVTVNDPDGDKRAARLDLLARFRDAVGQVADFGRIEG
jgi:glycyl-tRNA synthetase beta chain